MKNHYFTVLIILLIQSITAVTNPIVIKTTVLSSCSFKEQLQKIKENISNSIDFSLFGYNLTVSECGPGLWKQVIKLNMSNASHQCPSGWNVASNPRSCSEPPRTTPRTCAQVNLSVDTAYSKVCGRLLGLARGTNDAFASWTASRTGRNYVDGITVFRSASPPEHVWTFATDHNLGPPRCPCSSAALNYPFPAYVGSNYFCDSYVFDNAWNGSHCPVQSGCCTFNSPPWFNASLPNTSPGNLEVSICGDESAENESIQVQELLLYIQ